MKKLLWLLVTMAVVALGVLLLYTPHALAGPPYYDVEGSVLYSGQGVAYWDVEARNPTSGVWSTVATSDANGHYGPWHPSGWDSGTILMRAKQDCTAPVLKKPSGTPGWQYHIAGTERVTVNVNLTDCVNDPGKSP